MTNTPSIAETPAVEVPPRAEDAVGMATRLLRVARLLDDVNVKPSHLQCSNGYLQASPKVDSWGTGRLLPPYAADMVSVQVKTDELDLLAERWGFPVLEPDVDDGLRYASGLVDGIAVKLYSGTTRRAVSS